MRGKEPENPGEAGSDSAASLNSSKGSNTRLIGVFAAFWSLLALSWISYTIWSFSQGDRDYIRLVFGVLYLGLAIAYVIMWRRAKGRAANHAKGIQT
jgi:hypothetical protein